MTKDYKHTLNLPQTDFPMRANLSKLETRILKEWEDSGLYGQIRQKRAGAPKYILHDGPPYANGNIHQGHALNKVLKDLVVRIKTMEGFDAPYIPGWDCHGLPIEHQVDKKLGKKKREMTKNEIRKVCREYAEKFVNIQKEEFKRLGILGRWEKPYLTMDYGYEASIVRELGKFFKNGSLYKGLKPIHWCITCRTALAEAEVEYDNHTSPSIYVKFPIKPDSRERFSFLKHRDASLVIWTTTPWTIPANLAVSVNPGFQYAFAEVEDQLLVIAVDLLEDVMGKLGYEEYTVVETLDGRELEGVVYTHPFADRESPVILGDHVTLEAGTGLVHTAPGHGQDDYIVGLKYGLEVYNPVDDSGKFVRELDHFGGMKVWDANSAINELLLKEGFLLREEKINHSYPHCWRCKKPVIFRGTSQWFISMEADRLRERALSEIRKVKWIPEWGEERIYKMIEGRPDWCISRQRSWGVPITVFYCKECGEPVASKEACDHVAEMVAKEGADVWFSKEAGELLVPGTRCGKCGAEDFEKETDILDVWFDSGVSFSAVVEAENELAFPSDIYLEGSDQHRGWFHSSLLASVKTRGRAPYKSVLTHGYVVDGAGKKMSKSAGNVISPQEIISKYGAEIVRLWVSSENYREDIRLSEEILKRLSDAYRKIRNTFRYMLGNLHDFNVERDTVPFKKLPELDRFILSRLQKLEMQIRTAFDNHEYHVFFHAFHNFCTIDLSSFYLDICKDRIYTMKKDSLERRAGQTTLFELADRMVRIMAPVLSFTAEEIWDYIPARKGVKSGSVHTELFPEAEKEWLDEPLFERWEKIIQLRKEVSKVLEAARKKGEIGHSLDAAVTLFSPPGFGLDLSEYKEELSYVFITSKVIISGESTPPEGAYTGDEIGGLWITVSQSGGKKCERCWRYSNTVGSLVEHPTVCGRCGDNL